MNVRPLTTPTDDEIAQLAAIFDRYRAHYGETGDAATTRSWLRGHIDAGRLGAFVADGENGLAGFATAMTVPASLRLGHFWQIRDLFVEPGHRRVGVGRALLETIRTAAISAGALRVVLQTEIDNSPALRLYADCGYTAVEGYCSLELPLRPSR